MKNPVIIGAVAVLVLATGGLIAKGKITKLVNTQILSPATPTPNDEWMEVDENAGKAIQEESEANAIKNKTEKNITKPSPTFTPTPTESSFPESYAPTNEPPVLTMSVEQQKATKIISISDSLGNTYETNCQWSDTHYECPPKERRETIISIKTTPQLTFTINAQDPNNRPLVSNFYFQEGCNGNAEFVPWLPTNTCTLTLKTDELGLRTFSFYVKNDDNYGSAGLDANTSLYYRIIE